jgi:hypothetical protein
VPKLVTRSAAGDIVLGVVVALASLLVGGLGIIARRCLPSRAASATGLW